MQPIANRGRCHEKNRRGLWESNVEFKNYIKKLHKKKSEKHEKKELDFA